MNCKKSHRNIPPSYHNKPKVSALVLGPAVVTRVTLLQRTPLSRCEVVWWIIFLQPSLVQQHCHCTLADHLHAAPLGGAFSVFSCCTFVLGPYHDGHRSRNTRNAVCGGGAVHDTKPHARAARRPPMPRRVRRPSSRRLRSGGGGGCRQR